MKKKSFRDSFNQIDIFGEEAKFLVNGKPKLQTSCGAFLTILMFAGSVVYLAERLQFMSNSNASVFTSKTPNNSVKASDLKGNNGFEFDFAVGLLNMTNNQLLIQNYSDYGSIVV